MCIQPIIANGNSYLLDQGWHLLYILISTYHPIWPLITFKMMILSVNSQPKVIIILCVTLYQWKNECLRVVQQVFVNEHLFPFHKYLVLKWYHVLCAGTCGYEKRKNISNE